MNAYTPDPRLTEARRIADIAEREYERRSQREDLYGRNALLDLREIRSAALAVQDYLAGHDGFDDAPGELAALLADWGENVDCRTFGATPALDALGADPAMGAVWNTLLREGRSQLEER